MAAKNEPTLASPRWALDLLVAADITTECFATGLSVPHLKGEMWGTRFVVLLT
jgi:hypothetical protein